jgi:cytochrome c oxidase cbb3-type subunit 3
MPERNVQGLSFDRIWLNPGAIAAVLCAVLLCGCGAEKRAVGPGLPLTAPTGKADPRARLYEQNAYQVSEGGRMFRWQGCDGCHTETAPGAANLTDPQWRYGGATTDLYTSIAMGRPNGMPAYDGKIAPEQIWQIAGYLHGLPELPKDRRLRQSSDQQGEPQGSQWTGPVQ